MATELCFTSILTNAGFLGPPIARLPVWVTRLPVWSTRLFAHLVYPFACLLYPFARLVYPFVRLVYPFKVVVSNTHEFHAKLKTRNRQLSRYMKLIFSESP